MGNVLQKESWSLALLATSKRGGLYFVNFHRGVMCICDSKKTKTVPESMRGGQGVVFSHSSSSFLSPSTPFSLLPLFSFISCLPHFSPPFSHLSILPSLFPFYHPLSPFTMYPSSMWS